METINVTNFDPMPIRSQDLVSAPLFRLRATLYGSGLMCQRQILDTVRQDVTRLQTAPREFLTGTCPVCGLRVSLPESRFMKSAWDSERKLIVRSISETATYPHPPCCSEIITT
jgi:hypothetical protein